MPRGKRTVFFGSCKECNRRVATVRLHKQDKKGRGWKEVLSNFKKYCPACREHRELKLKEERHSK